MALILSDDLQAKRNKTTAPLEIPILRLGFRPFYLLAATFSAISVPLWLARYFGNFSSLIRVDLNWHIHEMVFGFAIAVIIGFLYTAGRNWTGLETPQGKKLAAIVGLWLAGRLAMLFLDPVTAAVIDLAFLPVAAWPLYCVLKASGNRRNMFLIVLLGLLTIANAIFHASVLGWLSISPTLAIQAAILIIVVIESVIGARVIPMFTNNGAPGSNPIVHPARDRIALVLVIGAALAWIAGIPGPATAALAGAAACAVALRLIGWKPHRTLRVPLLWILHLSYGWIAIGLLMLALAALHLISASAAFHALTVGSMAGLILGMMTRTSLGHTGRQLKGGPAEIAMYGLIQVGAVARVCAAVGSADARNFELVAAAACWAIAFLLFVAVYGPYLLRPRVDGRSG